MKSNASTHRGNARQYLEQAQLTTDLETRRLLIGLCEQELVAAVAARQPSQLIGGKRKTIR
jgi:hypothetical protein